MFERLEALENAVRQIQTWLRGSPQQEGVRFGEPPPPSIPTEDPERAKRDYEAAQAETKNQQDRAQTNIKIAQEAEARAKAILDKAVTVVAEPHPEADPRAERAPQRR